MSFPARHFDPKTNLEIAAHEASQGSDLVGFASWYRLEEVFRAANEIHPYEDITSFQVDARGICFRVRRFK